MIYLTGGAGFIGSAFLWKLNREGIDDVIVVDELDSSEKWRNLLGKRFSDYIQKDDFLDMVLEHKIPKPSHLIHMGACSSTTLTDADHYIRNNYEYSQILTEWALSNKAHFIYASSAATYGDGSEGYSDRHEDLLKLKPLNMYGFSKHMFDMWMLKNGVIDRATGIKFFNVYGPNEYHKGDMRSVVCKKHSQVAEEGRITLFKSYRKDYPDGGQKRDFIYIKDAVEVMWWLFNNPRAKGIYNLGTGRAGTWNDLAGAMFAAAGKEPVIEYIEMPGYLKPKYQYFTEADMTKLREAGCGHGFMSLEEAVKDYWGYLATGEIL
ncbi:MAG: ADP-glyceromanno-heptose 6-epimerase [Candidatus Omnitrophica bacterium]|nr:ADP-glyceromanno-heptose 6-epimerase [Candidatus Omnitrophota bacterium]